MRQAFRLASFCALTVLAATGCRSARSHGASQETYSLVFLVPGPSTEKRTPEERDQLQAGHMANIQRLADEGKLLVAGPFDDPRPDPKLRGIFVLDTRSLAEAREWVGTDPTVKAGTLAPEIVSFESSSALHRTIELERAMKEEARRSGRELKMGDSIRGYVMLFAHDGERAQRVLAPLAKQGHVLFAGEVEHCPRANYIAVLDSKDVAAARGLLDGTRGDLGKHELASWWSTKSLERINDAEPANPR